MDAFLESSVALGSVSPSDSVSGRKRILFFAEAVTFAHAARPFLLASALDPTRYECHFASSTEFEFIFEGSNLRRWFLSSTTAAEFQAVLRRGGVIFPQDKVARYVEEDLRIIDAVKPSVIIGDLRLSLSISAPFARVPYLALTNAYWSPFSIEREYPLPVSPLFQPLSQQKRERPIQRALARAAFRQLTPRMERAQAAGVNRVRRYYGLPPFADYLTQYSFGDRTLYADVPSLAPTHEAPPSHRYIGPLCWSPQVPLPAWWSSLREDRPVISIALGSSGDWRLLETILAGLRGIDAQIIIVTGNRDLSPKVPTEGLLIARYISGELLARRSSIVISNGGSPTTHQVLREGTSVLSIPSNMDQLLCSRGVQHARCGLVIRADEVSAERLGQATREILERPHFKKNAAIVGAELSRYRAEHEFERVLAEYTGGDVAAPAERIRSVG